MIIKSNTTILLSFSLQSVTLRYPFLAQYT